MRGLKPAGRLRTQLAPGLLRSEIGYLRSTRVPRIFWALSVLRKDGMTRSISSK